MISFCDIIYSLPGLANAELLKGVKPRIKIAQTTLPSGGTMSLYEHDGAYSISMAGQELMHSKASASEFLMGQIGVENLDPEADSKVLIGGLGLGFTLRSVLESVDPWVEVDLVELIPEVIQWNKDHLFDLNGSLLEDPRVRILTKDVNDVIRGSDPASYDAILMDVDNGPVAMVAGSNSSLYSRSGVKAIKRALKPSARAVFWSAGPDQKFDFLLKQIGFNVRVVRAKVHPNAKRPAYFIYVADNA